VLGIDHYTDDDTKNKGRNFLFSCSARAVAPVLFLFFVLRLNRIRGACGFVHVETWLEIHVGEDKNPDRVEWLYANGCSAASEYTADPVEDPIDLWHS
jgi:hypothetical protein